MTTIVYSYVRDGVCDERHLLDSPLEVKLYDRLSRNGDAITGIRSTDDTIIVSVGTTDFPLPLHEAVHVWRNGRCS